MPTTTAQQSVWLEPTAQRYPVPTAARAFDVLVLGGGITGLTTAVLLKRAGLRVAVVEAGRVGTGAPGLPRAVQRSGEELGLPLSRVAVRRGRGCTGGAGHRAARAQGAAGVKE